VDRSRVETEAGVVVGESSPQIVAFRGIPYAAPPTGERRWRAPQPAPAFAGGELEATSFGSICPQGSEASRTGDEDCLYLNVWAPRAEGSRPVMVFIHGGGFRGGSGSNAIYDGTNLALAGDVVVVTLNYRLGALGFLNHPALGAETDEGALGNYGILDQIAALEWVERNIAAFGGDPSRVTIFGESAGAVSVCALLGAPAADGLYHRAIIQSGGGCDAFAYADERVHPGAPTLVDHGRAFVDALGCGSAADPIACARGRSVDALLDASPNPPIDIVSLQNGEHGFMPGVDGVLLHEQPLERITRGAAPDVPVITGANRDEATVFTASQRIDAWNYRDKITEVVGEAAADDVLAVYPIARFGSARAAYDALWNDLIFACPAERFAAETTAAGHSTRLYEYTRAPRGLLGLVGAAHGVELAFVFGNYGAYRPNAAERELEAMIQTAWTSFAHDGAPSTSPEWSAHRRGAAHVAVLDEPLEMTGTWRGDRCPELRALGLTR